MRTHARRDGSDWVLNGAKMWITNGTIADMAVVWARTDEGEIRGFIVEKGAKGFSAPEIHKKISLRASVTSELVLEDVRVPADAMFPEVSTLRGPLSCLNEARYGIIWGVMGAARSCFETALEYSKTREQFGKPIGAFQAVKHRCADMLVLAEQARATVWDAARESSWEAAPVWVHGDMAAGNLLLHDGRLGGVIDFGCMAVGDPACDLTMAWTIFDARSRGIFRDHVDQAPETWSRARGWALWKALITLRSAPPRSAKSRLAQRTLSELSGSAS